MNRVKLDSFIIYKCRSFFMLYMGSSLSVFWSQPLFDHSGGGLDFFRFEWYAQYSDWHIAWPLRAISVKKIAYASWFSTLEGLFVLHMKWFNVGNQPQFRFLFSFVHFFYLEAWRADTLHAVVDPVDRRVSSNRENWFGNRTIDW